MSISTLTERIRCMGDSEESSFSKITSDFILLNVGDAISKVSLFVATVYLAKTLGVDNFGVYSFVQSFILVFMLMTDLGIEWNGVGQIAQHRLQADFQDYFLVYFNKVISTRIILALIAFGVIV